MASTSREFRCVIHDKVDCRICTKPIGVASVAMETDDELRERLIYIGVSMKELATMQLDKIAEQYRLRRRTKPKRVVKHDPELDAILSGPLFSKDGWL